ncbi:MAG: hypothetical protein ACFCU1_02220 [Sumerlaeia bacterium]
MDNDYLYKTRVEQGRGIAQAAHQPVTSLVRQEDLSFCASRLLMASRMIGNDDSVLAELIENTLGDMAAILPEDALKRVKNARGAYPDEPIYWGLSCHVLAQILSEYSREASAHVIMELRSCLPDWFGRFQEAFRSHKQPYKDLELLALMVYFAQTAIFHDKGAYSWVRQTMLYNVVQQPFCSETALELAALAGGALDPSSDQAQWRQLIEHLEDIDKVPPAAASVRAAIGGPALNSFDFVTSKTNRGAVGHSKAAATDEPLGDDEKSKLTLLMENFLEKFGIFLPWGGAIIIGGFCLWGSGMFLDKVFNTSPVGNQTLSENYEQMRKMNEQRKIEAEKAAALENGEIESANPEDSQLLDEPEEAGPEIPEPVEVAALPEIPVPTPQPTPTPTPEPLSTAFTPENAAGAGELPQSIVQEINHRLVQLPPRLKLARMAQTGHYKYGRLSGNPLVYVNPTNPSQAIIYYPISWFESGKPPQPQLLETHMVKQGEKWSISFAVRCTELTPAGPVRVSQPEDRAWVQTLFIENPFYKTSNPSLALANPP